MELIQLRRKKTKIRRYRFVLTVFLVIAIFIAISIFRANRNYAQKRREAFPVSTVEETLAAEVYNNTEVKKVYLPEHGNIVYEAGGEGEAVVLIHCWAGARQYWKYTIRDLLPYHRVYALDLKGFGESDSPESGYRMADFVDMLHDFFAALDIHNAVVVGHSMGGTIAMLFTLDYPEKVNKLVLVALPMSQNKVGHKLIGTSVIGGIWYRAVQFLGALSLREPKAREIWLKPTVASATQSMRSFVKANPLMRIREINCPALLILGKNDSLVAFTHSKTKDKYKRNFDLNLAIIDDARHSPHCENPGEFNKQLLAFLQNDESELIVPARIQ